MSNESLEILEGPTSVQTRQVFAVQHDRALQVEIEIEIGIGIGIVVEGLADRSDCDFDSDTDFDNHGSLV